MDKNDFSYYTYEVGRVGYTPETKKLVWNIIDYDFNDKKMQVINLFEYNWVFLRDGLLVAKKKFANNFAEFAEHVRSWLMHEYWSRCQYECIVSGWPGAGLTEEDVKKLSEEVEKQKKDGHKYINLDVYDDTAYKIDIYTQIMMNWDRFIEYVWNNKHLITERKLGLKK